MGLHSIVGINGFLATVNLVCVANPKEFNGPADRYLSVNTTCAMLKALHTERLNAQIVKEE